MIWSDYENTKTVIKAMWDKLKALTKSVGDNSAGDFWTRVTLGGVGVILMAGCVMLKVTKMKELLASVTNYGWSPAHQNTMALNNLGVRI